MGYRSAMPRSLHLLPLGLLAVSASFGTASRGADLDFSWALPTPQGNSLDGLEFESDSIGLAVGTKGAIVRTTDGGLTWTDISAFGDFARRRSDLLSLGGGSWLAVSEAPGIFRSDDGGFTWSDVANPSTGTLEDVERAGADLVAIGESGVVLRSTNGGDEWTPGASAGANPLREQHWFDELNGIVVGDHVARRTTDGGASWATLPGVDESQDFFNEVVEAAPGVLYTFADFHFGRSTNGGASWEWNFAPVFPVYRAKTVAFGAQHLLTSTDIEGAEIWESTNGGDDWTPRLQRFDVGGFQELLRRPSGVLFACTTEGDLFRSTDDGATWTNAASTPGDEPRCAINAFALLPGGRAYAGSTTGGAGPPRWLASEDGGETWLDAETSPGALSIEDIAFWDDLHGIVADSVSSVSRTSDGGATWSTSLLPNAVSNGVNAYDFSIPAPGVAFCAADGVNGALVFRSTDFGVTWTPRSSGIPQSTAWLGSVSFLDASVGFAAGGSTNQPRIWKTTDGGGAWTAVGVAGLPSFVNGMHWFDAQTGLVAIANTGQGIFRTTNGGASWERVFDEPARRLSFHGSIGVATRGSFEYGSIRRTTDAGATWETIDLPADRAGSCALALADGFLVGGQASQIVRATASTPTNAPAIGGVREDAVRGGIDLLAAPSVGRVIGLRLAATGGAAPFTLEIFDVAGRRVRTLGGGTLEAGAVRAFTWDGRGDDGRLAAAGAYFVRVAANDRSRTAAVRLLR